MTWQRGFFRLWVLFALLWFMGSVVVFAPQVWQEWQEKVQRDAAIAAGFIPFDPKKIAAPTVEKDDPAALGLKPFDPEMEPKTNTPNWSEFGAFTSWEPARPQPFWIFGQLLAVGVMMPLVLLGFGAALAWALRGFRGPLQRN